MNKMQNCYKIFFKLKQKMRQFLFYTNKNGLNAIRAIRNSELSTNIKIQMGFCGISRTDSAIFSGQLKHKVIESYFPYWQNVESKINKTTCSLILTEQKHAYKVISRLAATATMHNTIKKSTPYQTKESILTQCLPIPKKTKSNINRER